MNTKFEYYYNNVPNKGLCRNNLIYTSMISEDKKTFCQWYHNDTDYHKGQNQVVDPTLMKEKFEREAHFLQLMGTHYPNLVPEFEINFNERKVYLSIDGPDMWELASCTGTDYSQVLLDWDVQMLEIIQAHKDLGIYKYSMHPSSYFIVNGRLKSINYFFTYNKDDKLITPASVMSHISEDRKKDLFPKMEAMGIKINSTYSFKELQLLTFDSFKTNFNKDVMDRAKQIYV